MTELHDKSETPRLVLFTGDINDPSTLSEVIGQGSGAVSVCWEDLRRAGIFDSTRAGNIVGEMIDWIEANYVPNSRLDYVEHKLKTLQAQVNTNAERN